MLFWQLMRAADSRTFCTAGTRRPMRMAMIAITTSNSISVNARYKNRRCARNDIVQDLLIEKTKTFEARSVDNWPRVAPELRVGGAPRQKRQQAQPAGA